MSRAKMQYVIFGEEDSEKEPVMYAAPVPDDDYDFLQHELIPTMRPMSDEEYMKGPAVILHTLARFSYILFKDDLFWCAEWAPGLIVVRLSPDATFAWTALRSPHPEFGGRKPAKKDIALFDEDAENHQYNLVFDAWDAQFDKQKRSWGSFVPADRATRRKYLAALEHVNSLGKIMERRYSKSFDKWADKSKKNLEKWAGEGIRAS